MTPLLMLTRFETPLPYTGVQLDVDAALGDGVMVMVLLLPLTSELPLSAMDVNGIGPAQV